MDASHLFTAALRLRSPWRVGSADFRDADGDGREPHITIGFEPGRGFMLLFEAWVWLYRLCSWMMHSRLEPMKELARLFRRHFATIIYLTCGSSHINGSSDCDAQEQLRARLDCLLEPTGAGIDDLVDTPAGIWWGFRWHTGFQANPASGTAPDFGVGPVRMSIDCRLNRDRIRCPGSRFRAIFANRDNFCCPGINVNRFMRKPGQRANSRIGLIPPIPSARRYELRKPECPGSRKQAEIADRDSGFCPGRQVKRLTYEPGQIQIREKPMKQI